MRLYAAARRCAARMCDDLATEAGWASSSLRRQVVGHAVTYDTALIYLVNYRLLGLRTAVSLSWVWARGAGLRSEVRRNLQSQNSRRLTGRQFFIGLAVLAGNAQAVAGECECLF